MRTFTLLNKSLSLTEGPEGYRPSEDSFWLAWCLPKPQENAQVCDAGCGTGAVGLAYQAYHPQTPINLHGFDLNPHMVHAAQKSAILNPKSSSTAIFTQGCISAPPFSKQSFDLCFANPPFFNPSREDFGKTEHKNTIRFTKDISLKAWVEGLAALTKPKGMFALIFHAADAAFIEDSFKEKYTLYKKYTLISKANTPPKRAILLFQKGIPPTFHKTEHLTLQTFLPSLRQQAKLA